MNELKNGIESFTLSLEELSLAFGLINRPDAANLLIRSIYPNITDQQMESRLISATNSLLACGLCTLSEQKTPKIVDEFQTVIFPLISYDYLLHIESVANTVTKQSKVHVQQGKHFSSHSIQNGVIHILDHGSFDSLLNYLLDYFPGFGKGKEGAGLGKVPREVFDQAGKDDSKHQTIEAMLEQNGWSKSSAQDFDTDLRSPLMKGTLTRMEPMDPSAEVGAIQTRLHILQLVQGRNRSWLVDFPPEAVKSGDARSISDRADFRKALSELVAS